MIFNSFSSPSTKTVILLLHLVKVLEPHRIQSAHVQGYVKLKMDLVEGWFLSTNITLSITMFAFRAVHKQSDINWCMVVLFCPSKKAPYVLATFFPARKHSLKG